MVYRLLSSLWLFSKLTMQDFFFLFFVCLWFSDCLGGCCCGCLKLKLKLDF